MAIRMIPFNVRTFQELGLPPIIAKLAERPRGLILVTGPTGSGKSTTLAAIIDKINKDRKGHIITVEDPIEFIHRHQSCIVNQREVGTDTKSFASALKYALREDPDVILVGEMRDLETIAAALTIAETGHLALATLHTNSAAESINRIIDVFPSNQQSQVRAQLGDSAMEEALFLTKFATKVTVIHRRDSFRASTIMADRVMNHPKIEVIWNTVVEEVTGEITVDGVKLHNLETGERSHFATDGVFVAIGHTPNTKVFVDQLELDEAGYILTDPGRTETSVEGVYAAGDVTDKVYRQAITAAGLGCQAALDAERWLEAQD
jgi:nucleoside-triphosphatase THEP1